MSRPVWDSSAVRIAGCISRTTTAPLDRIKLTWQALGSKAAEMGLVGTVNKMLKEGGVGSLWRGNGVNCLKIAPESAIKFQAYEQYKQWLGPVFGDEKNGPVSLQTKFFAGAFAGATSQTIIYPMEVLKTRMCLRKSGQYSSIFDCAKKLYHDNGWRIFYRGYVPNMLGILPYAGIELALFETFKQSYVKFTNSGKEGCTPPVYVSVTAGALSSVCGQLATYPLALVRTKLQAQTAGRQILIGIKHTRGMLDSILWILVCTEMPHVGSSLECCRFKVKMETWRRFTCKDVYNATYEKSVFSKVPSDTVQSLLGN
ncbi:unnamed protein product [Echinostoma caproni]|uniref:Uncharacterized protein n=1 Tax=Echinostoma caproni TaxID=27848 RepID=A0A3P8HH76_9TREM|nr:unnamed protein product [Echinostoma caproni]